MLPQSVKHGSPHTSQQTHPSERNHVVGAQHRQAFCLDQHVSISEKSGTHKILIQEVPTAKILNIENFSL
jgi:hypothetical protein